jgi:NAD+ kinase
MSPPLIGLIAHVGKPGAAALVEVLREDFAQAGATVHLETKTAELVGAKPGGSTQELGKTCELLVALGGDGTILQLLHDLGENIRPIFGINLGSLGFLTCVSSAAHDHAVKCIVARDYALSHRTLLEIRIEKDGAIIEKRIALNDAVISRGAVSRLIRLNARIDGHMLTDYNADGLVISTPTGSTAYSLSAGGPILTPDCGVFAITPICPHVLTNRSVIISDQARITITPCAGQRDVHLTVDGQAPLRIEPEQTIEICKAAASLPLAMLTDITFSEVLRQKLKWSGAAI